MHQGEKCAKSALLIAGADRHVILARVACCWRWRPVRCKYHRWCASSTKSYQLWISIVRPPLDQSWQSRCCPTARRFDTVTLPNGSAKRQLWLVPKPAAQKVSPMCLYSFFSIFAECRHGLMFFGALSGFAGSLQPSRSQIYGVRRKHF